MKMNRINICRIKTDEKQSNFTPKTHAESDTFNILNWQLQKKDLIKTSIIR